MASGTLDASAPLTALPITSTGRFSPEPAEHFTLAARNRVHLLDDPANSCRNRRLTPCSGSVAAHAGSRAIGVVLSGSLDDGSRGVRTSITTYCRKARELRRRAFPIPALKSELHPSGWVL